MPRYIDADELLKVLDVFSDKEGEKADFFAHKNLDELSTKYNHGQYCFENVKEMVNTMPTADVVEVEHGKWNFVRILNHLVYCECSKCKGKVYDHAKYRQYLYCPHCGAKMDGKDDSNE